MIEIEKPKIIFYKSIDRGDGIKADALPGSVYWTSQKGASKAMEQKQIDDINLIADGSIAIAFKFLSGKGIIALSRE